MFPCTIKKLKLKKSMYSFFVQFVFECRIYSSLIFYGNYGGSGFTIVVQLFSHKDGKFYPSSRFRNSSGYVFYISIFIKSNLRLQITLKSLIIIFEYFLKKFYLEFFRCQA